MRSHARPAAAPGPRPHASAVPGGAAPARGAALALYGAAIFASAFLLFLVQPMFSRMVLPLLGGTPAVWNTCMLFFQAALLGGYLYAHLGARRLGVRRQAALHLALLAAAALVLPISVAGAAPEGGRAPVPWLLLLMAGTVGLPFFVLSGTGPMLQRWFAHTGHPAAANPYQLYAASNLGSFLALLGYPFLLEPRLRLAHQSAAWTAGYALLALLVAACAALVWRRAGAAPESGSGAEAGGDAGPGAARERALWVALAFLPSSTFLSVTTFITTDLAPVPLLWVLPLALYLLSFTLAFAGRPPLPHRWMVAAQPALLAAVAIVMMYGYTRDPRLVIPLHLLALFATAMVCHGELARRRPAVRHLTEFYLWISVGGVLGGVFNVLLAPVLFDRTWEYHLVLVGACLLRPWEPPATRRALWMDGLRGVGFLAALLLASDTHLFGRPHLVYFGVPIALAVMIAAGLRRSPLWLAVCIGGALLARSVDAMRDEDALLAERSFYGRYTVIEAEGFHALYHGSTLHGAQNRDPAARREPLTYYVPTGPFGQLFEATAERAGRRRVAVVGLGTGTSVAYGAAGEEWTFYEIDPGIVRIARDTSLFSYLSDTPARVGVVLGDARLSLARAPRGAYDLVVLDAFSSDAIPVHLLTREALGVYLERLAPGGLIVFHLSNRYLTLEPVVAALARERGLAARLSEGGSPGGVFRSSSTWAVVARRPEDLGPLAADAGWREPRFDPDVAPWTDDYSSILSVFGR